MRPQELDASLDVERQQAELKGNEAAMAAQMAKAGEGMGETRMQSISIRRESLEQVTNDLRDIQARLSEVLPKLVAARPLQGDWAGQAVDDRWRLEIHLREQ